MEKQPCATCRSATTLHCGLCAEATCKSCAHVLGLDAFSFIPNTPDHLTKGVYCPTCFITKVEADQVVYDRTMEAARNIDVYYKNQGKETRLMRREAPPYTVRECTDRDELILRLAFQAARAGYTTLVDVDIIGEKRREGTYQTTIFHGSGSPANAKKSQIPKDRSLRSNPN